MELQWIESYGGHHILLPQARLHQWYGTDPNPAYKNDPRPSLTTFEDTITDYDRAVGFEGRLGLVDVADGYGLVFAGGPAPLAWWPIAASEGYFVRWNGAEDDASVYRALMALSHREQRKTELIFTVEATLLVLFDSANPGLEISNEYLIVDLPIGEYHFESFDYDPDERTSFLLHHYIRNEIN